MIDVLICAEAAWSFLWIGSHKATRALLYALGILAASGAAAIASGWITRTFTPPTSPVFQWLEQQVKNSTMTQPVFAQLIPPEQASSEVMGHVQWVAYHVMWALLFTGITLAVFSLFVILSYLFDAMGGQRDEKRRRSTRRVRFISYLIASIATLYVSTLTTYVLGNLAWLRDFNLLTAPLARSMALRWTVYGLAHIQSWWSTWM